MPRATAARILLLAVAGGVLVDILVPGNAAGLNAPVLVAALLIAAHAVAGRAGLRRVDPADAWLGPAAVLFAAMAAVRADPWLVAVDLALAAALPRCRGGPRAAADHRGLVPQVARRGGGVTAAGLTGRRRGGGRAPPATPAPSRGTGPGAPGGGAPSGPEVGRSRPAFGPVLGARHRRPAGGAVRRAVRLADAVFDRLARELLAGAWTWTWATAERTPSSPVVAWWSPASWRSPAPGCGALA